MTFPRASLVAVVLAACGGGGGSSGDDGGGGGADTSNVPTMVTISGSVTGRDAISTTKLANVTIGAYANTDETTAVATTTSDAQGNYTFQVPTGGKSLDGFVKATFAGYVDTYLYPPAPVTADFAGASVNMVTPNTMTLLANTLCAANYVTTNGAIAVEVLDATMATIAGATVSSSPAATKYCYNQGGFPNKNATATDTDGIAYMFNITGAATVSAAKSGSTFTTHPVKARAGALTTTPIQP